MITSHSYVLLLVIQVTVISIIAIAMICAVMRSAARRHTIALSALALVMLSPLVTWLLPVRWQGLVTISSGVAEPVAAMFSDTERSADLVLPTSGDTLRADFIAETTTETNAAAALSPGSEPQPAAPLASSIATPDVLHSLTSSPSIVPIRSIGGARSPWVQSLFSALIAIWLIGAIIGAVRWVCRRRQLYSAVKTLQPISAVVLSSSVVQTICEALQIHELPAVCTSRVIPSPVVLGVLRPVVVLPEPLVDELSEQELSSVLIHECAHIVRDDHWIHAMQQIVGIVWWFHPGVLVLSRILSRSRKEVCDNYVLRQLPAAEFARTLLELTERCGTTRPVLSLLGIFGKHWSLESRVTELLNPERNMMLRTEPRWKTAIVSVLCICCLFVGGVSAVQKTNSETKQSATPTAPEPQEFNTSPKTDNAPQAEEPNPAAEPQPKASVDGNMKLNGRSSNRMLHSIHELNARPNPLYDIDFEQLYDLDTGRYAALPQKWRGRVLSADDIADITKWAAEEGFDMMGDEYKDSDGNGIYSIRGIGLKAWQLPDTRWKSLPSEFTVAQLQTEGRRVIDNWLLFKDSVTGTLDLQRHAPFYFVTREGTPGIIYVGIPVVDDSLKPGGLTSGDDELDPVAFSKGRRFGIDGLVPIAGNE